MTFQKISNIYKKNQLIMIDFSELQDGNIIYFIDPNTKQKKLVTFLRFEINRNHVTQIYTKELWDYLDFHFDDQFELVPFDREMARRLDYNNLYEKELSNGQKGRVYYSLDDSFKAGRGLYFGEEKLNYSIDYLHQLQNALLKETEKTYSFDRDSRYDPDTNYLTMAP